MRKAVVLVVLLCACSSGKGAVTKTTAPTTRPTSAARVHVGDTVKVENGTVTVHSFKGNVADIEACGGNPNPLDWRVSLTDHTTVNTALGVEGQLASGKIAPGDCVRGNVGFNVPKGAKVAAVVYAGFGEEAVPFTV